MDPEAAIKVLKEAGSDPAKQALACVDLAYFEASESERAQLRTALEAVAVPHWVDPPILRALLGISDLESEDLLQKLAVLSVVEPFEGRGFSAHNVHEKSRLAIRQALSEDDPKRLRLWSAHVADFLLSGDAPHERIEWIYHRLISVPKEAVTELENLHHEWVAYARPEDNQALAFALDELDTAGAVDEGVQAMALCVIGSTRYMRGEAAQLEELAERALQLSNASSRAEIQSKAHCLMGDVYQAQGKLSEALESFEKSHAIAERLAEQDSSNAGWQRDSGVSQARMGDVYQAQGKLGEALESFEKSQAIVERLVEQDPRNAGWQRDLGLSHSRMGNVYKAQRKLGEALERFEKYQAIAERLVEQDPSNAGWQRDLGVSHSRMGDVYQGQGKLGEALESFGKYRAIALHLVEQDSSNAGWQRDLGVSHSRMGDVYLAQGKLGEALENFEKSQVIAARLAEQDSSNAGWQFELGVSHWHVYQVTSRQRGTAARAVKALREALRILRVLVKQFPQNAQYQNEMKAYAKEQRRRQR
jgi:tetratricopeptide (TPR) repeat protein